MSIIRKLGFGLSALLFLLGCHLTISADPIFTPAFFISLAVSAATTAASAGLQYALSPKPKPQTQDKNKLSNTDIQASYIAVGSPIPELYGKDGIKIGVNFFYLSDIRHSIPTTTSSSGGGGKGGRKQVTTTQEHHYYQDIGGMIGMGPLELLEIRAGTKVLLKNNLKPLSGTGTSYEAEAGTLAGGANVQSGSGFSNGQKVVMPTSSSITFSVTGDGQAHATYIQYKTSANDVVLNVTINGVDNYLPLPNTFGRIESVMTVGEYLNGATSVVLTNPGTSVDIDKIVYGEAYVSTAQSLRLGGVSGAKNFDYVNPNDTYDYRYLDNPLQDDNRTIEEYNYQPNYNSNGETVLDLPAGCTLRVYEGNGTQLPDPVIEAHYASRGLGAPAHRHKCYFMLENFETTEYGGQTPQITVIARHKNIHDLGAMYEYRAQKVGLEPEEMDFSAFYDIPLRGFPITNNQSPKSEMERLNQVFDIDMYEDSEGVLTGIVPDETVAATLYLSDLDAAEESNIADQKPVEANYNTDEELPKELNVTAFDPAKDYEIGNGHAAREVTVSKAVDSFETGLVLTNDELQRITDRMFQKIHAEKDSASFKTFYRHAFLKPTDLVKVQNLDESFSRVRVAARNGGFPGVMNFSGKERDLLEPFPRIFEIENDAPVDPLVVDLPAHIIGTLIDVAILRTNENTPGFYAACARTDSLYQWKGASLVWGRETGYELLSALTLEATIGRATSALGDPALDSDGWDGTNSVTFDLFHGEVETRTDEEVLDRFNILLVGEELIAFANATRVNGYPNRWTVQRLRRGIKATIGTGHAANERIVLLNDAVKFIPIDVSEFGLTHDYKFVGGGQDIESASKFSFTWDGNTQYNTPAYQITDKDVPTLRPMDGTANSGLLKVSTIPGQGGNEWVVQIPTALKNGTSLKNIQLYVLNSTNFKTVSGSYSATDTSITLNNVIGLPTDGRIYIGQGPNDGTDEILSYTGISGNTLEGVTRGIDGTTARSLASGQIIFQIQFDFDLGAKYTHSMIQMDNTMIFIYRLQNGYFLSGKQGYSLWSGGTIAYGFGGGGSNPAPSAPPSTPVAPPEDYEDPFDPGNVGRDLRVY